MVLPYRSRIYFSDGGIGIDLLDNKKTWIMKTAEEILESHLTSMLSRTEDSYVTIDEMKQIPEWEACVNAIEQAQKEAYNQALEDAVEAASCEYEKDYLTGEIDKQSILKLKK